MVWRLSNTRRLIILIVANIFVYGIFFRWYTPGNSSHPPNNVQVDYFSSSSKSEEYQPISAPSIFKDAPVFNELVDMQYPFLK